MLSAKRRVVGCLPRGGVKVVCQEERCRLTAKRRSGGCLPRGGVEVDFLEGSGGSCASIFSLKQGEQLKSSEVVKLFMACLNKDDA